MAQRTTHEFACFYQPLDRAVDHAERSLVVCDTTLAHRFQQVLRLARGELLVLFGIRYGARAELTSISPQLRLTIITTWKLEPLTPRITLLLPLLAREAFEAALTIAATFGITEIVPITTHKTKRRALSNAEHARGIRCMIAACEQSKQFVQPLLHPLCTLTTVLQQYDNGIPLLLATPTGTAAGRGLPYASAYTCIVGPEGDFTSEEYALLADRKAHALSLGPSVLRSEVALTVLLGIIRAS